MRGSAPAGICDAPLGLTTPWPRFPAVAPADGGRDMAKAYGFSAYGGPEVQSFVDLPKPEPGPGQLLVAVRAAGVNPVDWKFRSGYLREMVERALPAGVRLRGRRRRGPGR